MSVSTPLDAPKINTKAHRGRSRVELCILQLLDDGRPLRTAERRRFSRQPFRRTLQLVPVDMTAQHVVGLPFSVQGKDISALGIGFCHARPLVHRFVVAALPTAEEDFVYVLLELKWQRFLRTGAYESGGRFVAELSAREAREIGIQPLVQRSG